MPGQHNQMFRGENGTWEVVSKLGSGGQGVTWAARNAATGDAAVLKEMRIEQIDDWKALELFEREVEALAALDHPGIPQLLDRVVEDGRTVAIVQTFVEGEDLASRLKKGPMAPDRFKQALRESLEILVYLHSRVPPLVHRDINPKNIMLGARTWLIDFGAVRFGHATNLTSVGTFGYMAPEQVMGRPTPASDVFSLGMSFLALAVRRDASEFPMDPGSGHVDVDTLIDRAGLKGALRHVLRAMTRPGVAERLSDPLEALRLLDTQRPLQPQKTVLPREPLRPVPQQVIRSTRSMTSPAVYLLIVPAVMALVGGLWFVLAEEEPELRAVPFDVPEKPVPVTPPPAETPIEASPTPVPQAQPSVPSPTEVVELTTENSAELELLSNPPSSVFIGGKRVGTTPLKVRRAFGPVQLEFRLANGRTIRRELMLIEDEKLVVKF